MDTEKRGNVHQEPRKNQPGKPEKNINQEPHKQGGHEKEHEHTERRPK